MIHIENYISRLIDLLRDPFASRLLYVGLQGSYLRGEATDQSDIDIMVVIDELTVSDLDCYQAVIRSMPYSERSCGFICSKTDLKNWNPLEIFQLLKSTKDYYGTLSELVPSYTEKDLQCYVKLSVCNLYHEICHRYVHDDEPRSVEQLMPAYKSAFFILQNLFYLDLGTYAATQAELLPLLNGKNHAVMKRSVELRAGIPHDFGDSFSLLFTWCQETLRSLTD